MRTIDVRKDEKLITIVLAQVCSVELPSVQMLPVGGAAKNGVVMLSSGTSINLATAEAKRVKDAITESDTAGL